MSQVTHSIRNLIDSISNLFLQVVLCWQVFLLFSPTQNTIFSLLFVFLVLLFHFAITNPVHNPHYCASQDRNAEDDIVVVVVRLSLFILSQFDSYDLFQVLVYIFVFEYIRCWHFLDCCIVIEPVLDSISSYFLHVSYHCDENLLWESHVSKFVQSLGILNAFRFCIWDAGRIRNVNSIGWTKEQCDCVLRARIDWKFDVEIAKLSNFSFAFYRLDLWLGNVVHWAASRLMRTNPIIKPFWFGG